jgi:hypothetical protein
MDGLDVESSTATPLGFCNRAHMVQSLPFTLLYKFR